MTDFRLRSIVSTYLLMTVWILVLLTIPLLSIYGRPLQYWVADTVGYTVAAWVIGVSILALITSLLLLLRKRRYSFPYFHIAWFLAVFLILPLFLDRVEERLHFLSFGLFGALSMIMFRPSTALIVCLLLSGADELLQLYLPDRVGDWRDVGMNMLASVASALFVWISLVRPSMAVDSINLK